MRSRRGASGGAGRGSTPREIHRLRSEAHGSLFRVRMPARAPEPEERALAALEAVTGLHGEEPGREEPDALRLSSKPAVEGSVSAAAAHVGEPPEADGRRTGLPGRRPSGPRAVRR